MDALAPKHEWSQADRAVIAGMLRQDASATAIGAHFGVSRNAVIGIIHRDQNLKAIKTSRSKGVRPAGPKRKRTKGPGWTPPKRSKITGMVVPKKNPGPVGHNMQVRRENSAAVTVIPERLLNPRAEVSPRMVALHDLESGDCRFPYGDPLEDGFGFCGHSKFPGQSYCAAHCAVAFNEFRAVAA
jgi:GcrA cell cycle regulator